MFSNQDFIDKVKREIRRRQNVQDLYSESTFFGDCIDLAQIRDTSPYLTAFLPPPINHRINHVRPWMYFMVLDTRLQLFVPVVKVKDRAFQCMGCRMSQVMGGTCCHVDRCVAACKRLYRTERSYGFLADMGINDEDHDNDRDSTAEDEVDSSDSENPAGGNGMAPNRSIRVREQYYPSHIKRPLLPCTTELQHETNIAKLIDNVPPGEVLALDDRGIPCHKCGIINNKPRYAGYRREVKLFTLLQGSPTIHIYDWYCDTCRETRRFSSTRSGAFPVRRKSCYTTELMYVLTQMTTLHSMPFRTAYSVARMFARTPSVQALCKSRKVEYSMEKGSKRTRRTSNQDFRAFINHLDTSGAAITNKLFSCENCEVPLSKQDCEELGINPDDAETKGMKRLKAVVLDGTAAGILTKLPEFDRDTAIVPPAEGGLGSVQLVSIAKHRKVLFKLLDIWKRCLRDWKKKPASSSQSPQAFEDGYLKFWIRNPTRRRVNGIECSKPLMTELENQITQIYIHEDACFCEREKQGTSGVDNHYGQCEKIRKVIARDKLPKEINDLFKQLLTVTQHVVPIRSAPENNAESDSDNHGSRERAERYGEAGGYVDDEEHDEEFESENSGEYFDYEEVRQGSTSGAWIRVLLPNLKNNSQFAESVIALLRFVLLEHIAMPYVGRLSLQPEQQQALSDYRCHSRPLSMQDGEHNDTQRDVEPHGQQLDVDALAEGEVHELDEAEQREDCADEREDDQDGGNESEVEVRGREDEVRDEDDQDKGDGEEEDPPADERDRRSEDSTPGPMLTYTLKAMQLHEDVITTMECYMSCIHFQEEGRVQSLPRECECVKGFKKATVAVNEASPVLGAFCQEFLRLRRPLHIAESSFGHSLLDILGCHIRRAKSFFAVLEGSLPEESLEYWQMYGNSDDHTIRSVGHGPSRVNVEVEGDGERNDNYGNSPEVNEVPQGLETGQQSGAQLTEVPDNVHHDNASSGINDVEHSGEGTNTRDVAESGNVAHRDTLAGGQHVEQSQQNFNGNGSDKADLNELIELFARAELEESQLTGFCFPGRRSSRPCIVFRAKDKPNCAKHYKVSRTHTPGLLTVQCTCQAPKLIGFMIVTHVESIALALSSILSHFGIPTRSIFYDNACNMFTSALLRVPWLLGKTRLAVDRFHYKSHKCTAYFNPDSYRQFDMERTETAESINARIEKNLNSMRYLKGENLITFLRAKFSILNLCAVFQDKFNRTDLEDEDMNAFFNSVVACKCDGCKGLRRGQERNGNDGEEDNNNDNEEEDNEDENEDVKE